MRTPRQRVTTAVVVLAVMSSAVALAVALWVAAFPADPEIDCARYEFPTRQWRTALSARPADEPVTRRLARNLVRCPLVLGRTPREVRGLLGAPYPDELSDGGGSLHYRVGANNSDDVSLYVEFRGGRAAYVSAPARERNARGSDISAGTPTRR